MHGPGLKCAQWPITLFVLSRWAAEKVDQSINQSLALLLGVCPTNETGHGKLTIFWGEPFAAHVKSCAGFKKFRLRGAFREWGQLNQ